MRIAFVHPDAPGAEGTGATHTATVIVQELVLRGHDVTVYARGDTGGDDRSGPDQGSRRSDDWTDPADAIGTPDGTEVPDGAPGTRADDPPDSAMSNAGEGTIRVRSLDLSGRVNHTATLLNRALRDRLRSGEFKEFDVVHSYLPSSLPALGAIGERVSARTVVTLNAYGGVCPKNDLRYMDREPCRERGPIRCGACSVATSPGHDEFGTLYRAASRLGNLRQVRAGLRYLNAVDVFQALSPAVRAAYAAFEYPTERMAVVPNPLDSRFLVNHESDFEPPYDLLYVGALERRKGVERLLPVLERVRGQGIDARLTVVGEGGRRSAMGRAVRDAGLEEFVTFSGRLPYAELPAVYARHDLFVYPGEWEDPSPRVVLEALSAGTPVVGTEVGGVPTAVGDAGVLTDSSVEGLSAGVAAAIRDRGLASLSERTRDELGPYRRDRVLAAIESLYREGATAVGGRGNPSALDDGSSPGGPGPG